MAGTKISQLTKLSTISGNENTVVQNGTTNNKVSLNKIKEFSSADSLKKTEQTFTDEERTQIQINIAPGGYSYALFKAAGATWDDAKGVWLFNGLELTNDEMAAVIIAGRPHGSEWALFYSAISSGNAKVKARTNLIPSWSGDVNMTRICASNRTIEVLVIPYITATKFIDSFSNCPALKEIRGVIDMSKITSASNSSTQPFRKDASLRAVRLKSIKISTSFSDSPLLGYDYVKYLIDNAANTSAITITVHATTYSYLTGTAEPTTEVGGTTEEWQALVTTAQEKQISFVSA